MTDQYAFYSNALNSLQYRAEEIKAAFDSKADENGVIDADNIMPLLSDLSALFSVSFEEAAEVISKQNTNITNYFDLEAINFDAFMELIKIWLQNLVRSMPQTSVEGSIDLQEYNNNAQNYEQQYASNDQQYTENQQQYTGNEQQYTGTDQQVAPGEPKHYRKNRERLDALLMKHRDRFTEIFYQRQNPETQTIYIFDWLTFIQECLSCDCYILKERDSDTLDFFRSANSYNKLASVAMGYFMTMRGADPNTFDVQQVHINLNECFEIFDYWFQADDEIVLYDEQNDNQSQVSVDGSVRGIMMETIAKYQKMLADCTNEVDKQILVTTIDTLSTKLHELETGEVTNGNGKKRRESSRSLARKKEEKKMKALRETFDFYAKQQVSGGKAPTFSKIQHQFNTINLGKFSVILKNFRIKIDNLRLRELFKKISHNTDNLTFDEFIELLQKVSKEAELITEVKVYKPNPDIRKDYKPDSYKKMPYLKVETKVDIKKREYDTERVRDDPSKPEELWSHMGLFDGKFRKNLQTIQLAFNSPEKETFRIPPESLTYKFREKLLDGKSPDEIKEEVSKRNELRRLVKDAKTIEKSLLKNYRDSPSRNYTDRVSTTEKRGDTYAELKAQRNKVKTVQEVRVSMKDIPKCKFGEMNQIGLNIAFDPFDLINENDEEDNIYLAEYNLDADIKEKKTKEDKYINFNENAEKPTKARNVVNPPPQKRHLPGKYSYPDNSHVNRSSTSLIRSNVVPPINPQPASLNDINYGNISKSTQGLLNHDVGPRLRISHSVKHTMVNPNLRNIQNVIYEEPQGRITRAEPPMDPQVRYYSVATPMGYPSGAQPIGYSAVTGVIGRANQVQQQMQKKESQMIHNILNNRNNQVEKGLRVARK